VIGREVGIYKIVKPLAEGGMGDVYLAKHLKLDKKAVVKFIKTEILKHPRGAEAVKRFLNEAKVLSELEHPNIVEILDFGELQPEGAPYIVMKFLEGESLAARLKDKRITIPTALDLAIQVTQGLTKAHELGIVHRDLKPDNLFLVPDPRRPDHDELKILDFGIAKLLPGQMAEAVKTQTGLPMGTPQYMSPEQCEGNTKKNLDHRSDIYSLGVILYEMVCGIPPFVGEAWTPLLMHVNEAPKSPRLHNLEIPKGLEKIVLRALEKDPADRFQTAQEFQLALREASRDFESEVVSDAIAESKPGARIAGRAALAAVVVTAVAVLVLGIFGSRRQRSVAVDGGVDAVGPDSAFAVDISSRRTEPQSDATGFPQRPGSTPSRSPGGQPGEHASARPLPTPRPSAGRKSESATGRQPREKPGKSGETVPPFSVPAKPGRSYERDYD
jgi:serine/threonine protein kinase